VLKESITIKTDEGDELDVGLDQVIKEPAA
jgi:hypothetical protein